MYKERANVHKRLMKNKLYYFNDNRIIFLTTITFVEPCNIVCKYIKYIQMKYDAMNNYYKMCKSIMDFEVNMGIYYGQVLYGYLKGQTRFN